MSALFDPCGFPMNLDEFKIPQPTNLMRWSRGIHDKSMIHSISSVLGNTPQACKLVQDFQRMESGQLAYELIAPFETERTVPKKVLGNHYIIANPRPYIFIDIVGNGWTLGTCQMVPSSFDAPFFRYSGDEPTLHGEKLTYPLPKVLQPFITEILNYTPPHNKWGSQGDTLHPSNYSFAHLQPIAKLFFDRFAPESIIRLFLRQDNNDHDIIGDVIKARRAHKTSSILSADLLLTIIKNPVESNTVVQEDINIDEIIDYIQSLWK